MLQCIKWLKWLNWLNRMNWVNWTTKYNIVRSNKGQNNPRDIHNSFRESSVCLHMYSICQRKSVRPVFSIKIGGIPLMVGWLAADRSLTWPNGMAKMSRVHKCPRMSKCPLLLNNPFVWLLTLSAIRRRFGAGIPLEILPRAPWSP